MRKPLEGIRVIDLSRVLSGPFCSLLLADLGAEVIKVELPGEGDDSRSYGPFVDGKSTYFMSINRNKKSITLDLKNEDDCETLAMLLTDADVLLENFRPGALARLGFTWERLQELNQALVCCHISGFGQTGPYKDWPAYDIIVQSMSGLMSINGQADGPPTRAGISIGDLGAGLYAAIGILAAVRVAEHTGQGQEIDISMLDCQLSLLENAVMRWCVTGETPQRLGNRHPVITPFTVVKTKDSYMSLAAGNDRLWQQLCELLGHAELAHEERFLTNRDRTDHAEELQQLLEGIMVAHTTSEWLHRLRAHGMPCAPINTVADALNDPHLSTRGMLWDLAVGDQSLKFAGSPIKLSHTPCDHIELPPPELGQHNDEIIGHHSALKRKQATLTQRFGRRAKEPSEPVVETN